MTTVNRSRLRAKEDTSLLISSQMVEDNNPLTLVMPNQRDVTPHSIMKVAIC